MDLHCFLRAIRKRWWLVLGSVMVALGGAILLTSLTPPKYAATVTFFVGTQTAGVSDALQGSQFSQERVKSYVDVVQDNVLARRVVANKDLVASGTKKSATDFQREIRATAKLDTVLLDVTVTDRSKDRALRLTEALAAEFPTLVEELEAPTAAAKGQKVFPTTTRVRMVATPTVGDTPISPRPLLNVGMGILMGLAIGVGGALLREALDTTVKTAADLHTVAETPVLGAVPFDARAKKTPLIIEGSARSSRAEAMRQLRTNLEFVNIDRPPRTLAVTSAMPGEGKSSTACNLAIVFAEAGQRVVLVDADLRRPRIADYLGLEGAVGLTNVVVGKARLVDAMQPWGSSGIAVLPSGSIPPNPSELLGSRAMLDLIRALSDGFDVVIIDTPPLLPFTDAAIVSARVDGAILVTRCNKTTAAQARDAAAALRKVGATLLGAMLNMADGKRAQAYAYYEYEYGDRPPARHSAQTRPGLPSGRAPAARAALDYQERTRDVPSTYPKRAWTPVLAATQRGTAAVVKPASEQPTTVHPVNGVVDHFAKGRSATVYGGTNGQPVLESRGPNR